MNPAKKVLLIDDDGVFHLIHQRLLMSTGIASEIKLAKNGIEGIAILKESLDLPESRPDIIFVDLDMPVMDGFGFIEAYNNLSIPGKENIVVSILSSSTRPQDIERARSLGVTHYLNKPLSTPLLNQLATFFSR